MQVKLRQYQNEDCETVAKLFYETVHTVNAGDYTVAQLSAWANSPNGLKNRKSDLLLQKTLVAEKDGIIVGFGSIDETGCLDLLFTHKNYQRQGIATALCDVLERDFSVIKTYASITAKPFFEKRGYAVLRSQEAERSGVRLINYEMQKNTRRI